MKDMKFLKYKISLLSLALVTLTTFMSCEDNESGVVLIDLEARFITEMPDSRTVSFINASKKNDSDGVEAHNAKLKHLVSTPKNFESSSNLLNQTCLSHLSITLKNNEPEPDNNSAILPKSLIKHQHLDRLKY